MPPFPAVSARQRACREQWSSPFNTSTSTTSHTTGSALLNLPAELREQIWVHAVTSWTRSTTANGTPDGKLEKQPIRVDNLNRPLPPALTRVNRQCYTETLHLYYTHNIFECWRPLLQSPIWSTHSTLAFWLNSLGPEKVDWLTSIVLLYKRAEELEDLDFGLALELEAGYVLRPGVLTFRQELNEYELCFEQLGLPARFGSRGYRWVLSAGG
jgi:hypothetical protein